MKMIIISTLTILITFLSFQDLQSRNQTENEINTLFYRYSSLLRPQKVYLHLDKSDYKAGESIWLQAYLFDGAVHRPDTDTNNIYIELINSSGNPVELRTLLSDGGYAAGDISLDRNLPEGNYIIRAYSDWMRNFGEEYYFTRYLYIKNPGYEDRISRSDIRRNRRFNRSIDRMADDFEVAFFPEGGDLVAGTNSRVAVKVNTTDGRGTKAEGTLTDDGGNRILTFETGPSGIGTFEFIPEPGKNYMARFDFGGRRPSYHELPEVKQSGYSLRVDQSDGRITVIVKSAGNQLQSPENHGVILAGHTRGIPGYLNTHELSNGSLEISIDERLFISGITHFTLFKADGTPVAERLVFVNRSDKIYFSPEISRQRINQRDYIDLQLTATDESGMPLNGIFSLSAVAGRPDRNVQRNDIVSYILLDSDIGEMIHDPEAYLFPEPGFDVEVDDLLLTYGWRRFNWEDILAGRLPDINYQPMGGLALGGRIIDPSRHEGVSNHPVHLKVGSGHNNEYITNSGRGGRFRFGGLVYEGMVEIELSSRRLSSDQPPIFELDILSARDYNYDVGMYTLRNRITERGDGWQRGRSDSGASLTALPASPRSPRLFGAPDQTIYIDYSSGVEKSLYEVLIDKGRGLVYRDGMFFSRGATSSTIETSAMRFMLDGRFIDSGTFLRQFPRDIERIEIFSGTSASIFGSRGGTGVILAYSRRRGYSGLEDAIEFMMQGYHQPREYYSDYVQSARVQAPGMGNEITVHWAPELITGADGKMNIRVPVYQGLDHVRIRIEGAGYEGGLGFAEFLIELKE